MQGVMAGLSEIIPRGGRVIDVGVGTGRFAKPLQEMGYDVVGIDISKRMMAKAKEKGVENLFFSDVHRTPFRDSSFESALLVHVLHLVSDWPAVVAEAARVSRGTLVSVLEKEDGDDPGADYRSARTAKGYPTRGFDRGERELGTVVPPDRRIRVVHANREGSPEQEMRRFERKEMSVTWDVPDEVHREIIDELRTQYGGRTLRWVATIDVAVWSTKSLRGRFVPPSQKG